MFFDILKQGWGVLARDITDVLLDGDDFVGGNYAAALNFSTTLPMFLSSGSLRKAQLKILNNGFSEEFWIFAESILPRVTVF